MRFLKGFFIVFFSILVLAVLLLVVTGNSHILNGIGKTYLIGKTRPDIDDLKYFDVSTIKPGKPEPWAMHEDYHQDITGPAQSFLDSMGTTALLVIHRDSLLLEYYADGVSEGMLSNSFSMAKSFLAMMFGPAVRDGHIKSLDQPVGDFIEKFKSGKNSALTIRHLLQMSSGIPFGESYSSPFGYMARAYYGKDLEEETLKFDVEETPGTRWLYEGGNSVLLGLILKKATGKTPSRYFEETVWSRIGCEHEGHWNLDRKDGLEKTFSGFYATARDFARIGKLYLHNGICNGDTLIDPEYVRQSVTPVGLPDINGEQCTWYGYHWWLGKFNGKELYSCRGLRGQYIVVIPEDELIIVRLGHEQQIERRDHMPVDLFRYLEIAVETVEKAEATPAGIASTEKTLHEAADFLPGPGFTRGQY